MNEDHEGERGRWEPGGFTKLANQDFSILGRNLRIQDGFSNFLLAFHLLQQKCEVSNISYEAHVARMWLGSGSEVARKWLGGLGVARGWLGSGSEVARMWLGGGSDVARRWLGRGSDMAYKWFDMV